MSAQSATLPTDQVAPEKQHVRDEKTLPTFTELLIASGSDKYDRHHYERWYSRWLEPYRRKPDLKMLEIGVYDGASLKLWEKYFVHPKRITGLGYGVGNEVAPADNGVTEVIVGDQSKGVTMELLRQTGPFEIIIDDGSHVPEHVIFTFFQLWSSVKPGGLYIIEDLETSYWSKATIYGYPVNGRFTVDAKHSVVAKVTQFIHVMARYQLEVDEQLSVFEGDKEICEIMFGWNLLAIYKCTEEEYSVQPKLSMPVVRTDREGMAKWLEEARSSNPTDVNAVL